MAFDPDAFLAQKPAAGGFDPDAFLAGSAAKKPTREELIAAIPDQEAPPKQEIPGPRRSFLGGQLERLIGEREALLSAASGAVALPVGSAIAAYKELTGQPADVNKEIEALTYAPRTQTGRGHVQTLSEGFEASKLPMLPGVTGGLASSTFSRLGTPALRQVGVAAAPAVEAVTQAVKAPLEQRAARIAAERSAASWERAPQIEAAQLAPKYDIALDPAKSNPTLANRVKATLSGASDLDAKLSARNESKWIAAAKDAMNLPKESVLDKAAFDRARSNPELAGPYDAVRNIDVVKVPQATYDALERLRVEPLYGDTGQAAATNAFIDNLKTQLQQGGNGGKLLDSVKQLRQEAQNVFKSEKAGSPISPEERARANAKLGAAEALEAAIEESIPNAGARKAFANARTKMAQTYDFEAATNFATGKIDPQVLAKMAEEGRPLSGVVDDLAKIAANYPETSKLGAAPETRPRLTRTGVSGTIGGVLGNVVAPGVGWVPGTALGAGVGYLSSGIGAKRMASPGYQLRHAVPADYRMPAPFQEIPPTNALVPYSAAPDVLPPEYKPNWTYGPPTPDIQPAMPNVNNLLAEPTPESVINTLRAEDARRARMSRMAGQEAEAAQAAAEAAARRPTSGGLVLEVDPITGKLREASQGIKGATPETMSNFGSSLEMAANKVSAGQRFAMSATEKIAWDKTKVDLDQIESGFSKLSDKAVAGKMMDREWVAQAVDKARQKAAAFDQIAARASDERIRQTAAANRERLMSLAEDMEESLRKDRPVSTVGQGKKTREFIRNQLLGNEQPENALAR